jgi:hypothetical protein
LNAIQALSQLSYAPLNELPGDGWDTLVTGNC